MGTMILVEFHVKAVLYMPYLLWQRGSANRYRHAAQADVERALCHR